MYQFCDCGEALSSPCLFSSVKWNLIQEGRSEIQEAMLRKKVVNMLKIVLVALKCNNCSNNALSRG